MANTILTPTQVTREALRILHKKLTFALDDFAKRILEPAMSVLAANIEADAFNMYKDVYNLVGVAGTTPATLRVFLDARARLNQFLTPKDNRRDDVINFDAMTATVDALKGLFHDSSAIAKQYKDGILGKTGGVSSFGEVVVVRRT